MTESFGEQAAVLAFAARLAVQHPHLPSPGLSVSSYFPDQLQLVLGSPGEVEAWREALHVADVEMRCESRSADCLFVGFKADVEGFQIKAFALFDDAELAEVIRSAAEQEVAA